jgi:hypothetical protein
MFLDRILNLCVVIRTGGALEDRARIVHKRSASTPSITLSDHEIVQIPIAENSVIFLTRDREVRRFELSKGGAARIVKTYWDLEKYPDYWEALEKEFGSKDDAQRPSETQPAINNASSEVHPQPTAEDH